MKKTPLKRKTPLKTKSTFKRSKLRSKPLNSKKAKKPRKQSIRQLKDKLWAECKRLTREKYGNTCYTCGKYNLDGSDWQTGHGKAKASLPLRYQYDLRNLRPQCMICNVHRGGMTDIFIAKLEQEEEGYQFLIEACYFDLDFNAWRIKQDTPLIAGKDATIFVENLLKQYKEISYPQ